MPENLGLSHRALYDKLDREKIGFSIALAYVLEHQLPLKRCTVEMHWEGSLHCNIHRIELLDHGHKHA